ncbi:740_t:CDS:10, partial [Entrophospora sp. SA101]
AKIAMLTMDYYFNKNNITLNMIENYTKSNTNPNSSASASPSGNFSAGKKKSIPVPVSKDPCGPNCYHNILSTSNEGKGKELAFDSSEWSAQDIILYNKARELFGSDNHCFIAKTIKSKSCQQIYLRSCHVDPFIKNKDSVEKTKEDTKKKAKKAAAVKIDNNAQKQNEYTTCNHPGEPCDKSCPCFKANVSCEKYCFCDPDCIRRFSGCDCHSTGGGICLDTNCHCFNSGRECDPDRCRCPASKCSHEPPENCKNMPILKGCFKHTLVGISNVSGWGLYVMEYVNKNDYLGEYVGELISQKEAERRGRIYDKRGVSFLFNLNKESVIDATRKGNKFRFINHSSSPNTACRIAKVNGEHRIGIYAIQDLEPGQELFFDYSYGGEPIKFKSIERDDDK